MDFDLHAITVRLYSCFASLATSLLTHNRHKMTIQFMGDDVRNLSIVLFVATISAANVQAADKVKKPPQPVNVSNQPSLSETTDWMKEKLAIFSGGSFGLGAFNNEQSYQDFKFDGCTMAYKGTLKIVRSGKVELIRESEYAFSFSDIDPERIRLTQSESMVGIYPVTMETIEGATKISVKSANGQIEQKKRVDIILSDSNIADRLINALKNAASQCKSRRELF